MQTMPFFHSYDAKNKHLKLRGAQYVPKEVFAYSDKIEILDLNDGELQDLPKQLIQLKKLRVLFASNNPFEHLPSVLGQCQNLEIIGFKSCRIKTCLENNLPKHLKWLILTDNLLTSLPETMGDLQKLQKVSLAGNQLKTLPESMQKCSEIEFLRLSANQLIEAPPSWIFKLKKLAWYGDNGNPFCQAFKTKTVDLATITYEDLEFAELLGQSPSSQVYKAMKKDNGAIVAVKLYRGQLTSDGYPFDDMYAAMVAGKHKGLITIIAKLDNAPNNKKGLVLEWIPENFNALGLPPTLQTCTRDTYPASTSFSPSQIQTILKNIAEAANYLHSKGLAHGDLYAHNILYNQQGEAYLGDFGAASFYDNEQSDVRQRIEVRAFGCLVAELLMRCQTQQNHAWGQKMQQLQQQCQQPNIDSRPLFRDILQFF